MASDISGPAGRGKLCYLAQTINNSSKGRGQRGWWKRMEGWVIR